MKKILIILFLFFVISPLFSEKSNEANNVHSFYFGDFLFDSLPGSFFPHFFLENYAPDVTLMIEENNGFSHIDHPRVYFEGEPYTGFNWFYNGFNLNSALEPGRSAVIFPFSTYSGYELRGTGHREGHYGLHISSGDHSENFSKIVISSVLTDLGSYTPLGPVMIQPEHPSLRNEMLYSERRRINSNYFADYMLNQRIGKGYLSIGFNHYFIKRDFNDFNKFDEQFSENGKYLVFSARYKQNTKRGFFELLAAFNDLSRDNQYSELGRLPQETSDYEKNSFFTGLRIKSGRLMFSGSLTLENMALSPYVSDYEFNIFDNDGDDIFPLNTYGKYHSGIFNGDIEYSLSESKHFMASFFGNSRISFLSSREYSSTSNRVFAGTDPYQVILWEGGTAEYSNSNLNLISGLRFIWKFSGSSFLSGAVHAHLSTLDFENGHNNLSLFEAGFDLSFNSFSKRSKFSLSISRTPGDIRENINGFLENSRPSGRIYSWNDNNDDGIFQSAESGSLFGVTGGGYHGLDPDFRNRIGSTVALLYSRKISKNFVFNLKALYKQFENTPWVVFNGDPGIYEDAGDVELYYFTKPPDGYILTNYFFEKDPFYGQFLINFTGSFDRKWFFSFSFMAHMGMSYTSFGNGPGSNDIGIINESMANPNSWINGFGRVDGDRGFVSKLNFGMYIFRDLFLGVSIKYRDGDPFAFLNRKYANDQWVLYYSTIQAEDHRGIKGGPREDYVSDISFKLTYRFRMFGSNASFWFSFFNVLDFGSELSEYVFSGGERYSMELQIPKSIRMGLSFEL